MQSVKIASAGTRPEEPDQLGHCLRSHLQLVLHNDIARIFDESLYTDIELILGKLKVSTHRCILKARSPRFYETLQFFLKKGVNKETFTEIESFICDTYSECDIKKQEDEILEFIEDNSSEEDLKNSNLFIIRTLEPFTPDSEVFLTPKASPCSNKSIILLDTSNNIATPSDQNLLEKELTEQDELLTAFRSILKTQNSNPDPIGCKKPTTLSLRSSHTSRVFKHSSSCDFLSRIKKNNTVSPLKGKLVQKVCDRSEAKSVPSRLTNDWSECSASQQDNNKNIGDNCEDVERSIKKQALSPDSLIDEDEDDFSSPSDYLTPAANLCPSLSEGRKKDIMDSGQGTLLESSDTSALDSLFSDVTHKITTKEEKERYNLEMVLPAESSSVSSETGSWESIFPPRNDQQMRDVCVTFIEHEQRQAQNISRPSAYFIDASTLADNGQILTTRTLSLDTDNNSSDLSNNDDSLELVEFDALEKETSKHENGLYKSDVDSNEILPIENNNTSMEATCVVPDTPSNSILQVESRVNSGVVEEPASHIRRLTDSPHRIQKCDESLPIISGGATVQDFVDFKPRCFSLFKDISGNKRCNAESTSSWIVDMSECKSSSLTGNSECSDDVLEKNDSLSTINSEKKKSFGFYVDFSSMTKEDKSSEHINENKEKNEKGNMFSIYIDLGDNKCLKDVPTRLSCSADGRKDDPFKSINKTLATKMEDKDSSQHKGAKPKDVSKRFSEITAKDSNPKNESDVLLRNKNLDVSNTNRHSWSASNLDNDDILLKDYIRKSLSLTKFNETSKDVSSHIPSKKESNYSLSDISFAEFSFSKSETSSVSENTGKNKKDKNTYKKHRSDVKFNETFDKSSSCSNKNILSQDSSPTITENEELTYHPEQNLNIIKEGQSSSKISTIKGKLKDNNAEMEGLWRPVKLSDLDKPSSEVEEHSEDCIEAKHRTEQKIEARPNRSNYDPNRMSHSTEFFSSFHSENIYSLARLFPELRKEFSKSTPGGLGSHKQQNPTTSSTAVNPSLNSSFSHIYNELLRSNFDKLDLNDHSSLKSSSLSTNEIVNEGQWRSRLGADLLRMFLEEIASDVIIQVEGRNIKAHKCILSSRCLYFASMLSGGWVACSGNVISLKGFSYDVVHFALCFIYSGASTIPDTISIFELAALADMLSLEGLKEVIIFTLKVKYCHLFHKPCKVCSVGVLECLPLSSAYGLDEIYRKSIDWITKHFEHIWPIKEFIELPSDLINKCYLEHVMNLCPDTVIDTVVGCERILMASGIWGSKIRDLVSRLVAECITVLAEGLARALRSPPFKRLAESPRPHPLLDQTLATAADKAIPRVACQALGHLLQTKSLSQGDAFAQIVNRLTVRLEGILIRSEAWRGLINTQSWMALDSRTQARLQHFSNFNFPPPSSPPMKRRVAKSSKYSTTPSRTSSCGPSSITSIPTMSTSVSTVRPAQRSLIPTTKNPKFQNTKSRYLQPVNPSSGGSSRTTSPSLSISAPTQRSLIPRSNKVSSMTISVKKSPKIDAKVQPPPTTAKSSKQPTKPLVSTCAKKNILPRVDSNRTASNKVEKIPPSKVSSVTLTKPKQMPLKKTVPVVEKSTKIGHGSLYSATQSTKAKMVAQTKTTKVSDPIRSKPVAKSITKFTQTKAVVQKDKKPNEPTPASIPIMQRSGTFLKDEPTVLDKFASGDNTLVMYPPSASE